MAYQPGAAVPWLPAGVSELPAERFVLFADTDNLVQLLNESVKTGGGQTFTGVWLSQNLNRKDPSRQFTLAHIAIFYAAAVQHTITVKGSKDGGKTFSATKVVTLPATDGGQVDQVNVTLGVTGKDLRVQIEFDSNETPNWFGYLPSLIVRGKAMYGAR